MADGQLDFMVGDEGAGCASAWLVGSASEADSGFNFLVDLCERNAFGDHMACRIELGIHKTFTAEIFLLLIERICDQPFTPACSGLSLISSGDRHPFSTELRKLSELGIRKRIAEHKLAVEDLKLLDRKLAEATRRRTMQRLLLCLPWDSMNYEKVEPTQNE